MALTNRSGADLVTVVTSLACRDRGCPYDNATSSHDNTPIKYITLICYLITFVFGALGNFLVMYIIARFSEVREKSVANYYIFNLALADEVYVLTLPVFCYMTFAQNWIFGTVSCKILYGLRESNKFGSIFTLVALSLDRYIASFHNLGHLRTILIGKCVCVCVWVLSLGMCIPYLIYASSRQFGNRHTCQLYWPRKDQLATRRIWAYSQLTIGLILPFLLILLSYILLIRRLKAIMKPRKSDRIRKPNRKMTRTILVVVIIFLLCNVPYYVMDILNLKMEEVIRHHMRDGSTYTTSTLQKTLYGYFNALATILVFISSCCNPVLYGILNDNYRKYIILSAPPCAYLTPYLPHNQYNLKPGISEGVLPRCCSSFIVTLIYYAF